MPQNLRLFVAGLVGTSALALVLTVVYAANQPHLILGMYPAIRLPFGGSSEAEARPA